MAKKRKSKLNKRQKLLVNKYGIPVLVGIVCLNIGIIGTQVFGSFSQPRNIIWAADNTVSVPMSLKRFLNSQNSCAEYRGTGTPKGVGLWGVYQVSKGQFAKIAYGCSWNLDSYIMAVRGEAGWELLKPTEYFAPFVNSTSTGALPRCKVLETHKIDKSIEPFCINDQGSALANTIK